VRPYDISGYSAGFESCEMPAARWCGRAAGHCPTLGPKAHLGPEGRVGFAAPPYAVRAG
jgi:hypothetical protein